MKRNIIVEVVASLLIILFVYAAMSKLLNYDTFKLQLRKSPFIIKYSGLIAWALPVVELMAAFLVAFARTRLIGSYASLFLMTAFSAYIYAMLRFSYYIPCSCGGILLSKMSWKVHLWFNIFFMLLSIAEIIITTKMNMQYLESKN